MQVSQQQVELSCDQKLELLVNLNSSRFSVERPVERFFNNLNKKNDYVYFECPEIVSLSDEDRREMLVKTFQLGNMLFHDFSENNASNDVHHSYSLINIEINDDVIRAIEENENKSVYVI